MNDELKKAVQKSQVSLQKEFPKEHEAFKGLLLANPNYFGTLEKSTVGAFSRRRGQRRRMNRFAETEVCVTGHLSWTAIGQVQHKD